MADKANMEFSRPVKTVMIPPSGREFNARADGRERAGLAYRFGLEKIEKFEVTGAIKPINAKTYDLLLTLNINYTAICVASQVPLDLILDHDFEITATTIRTNSLDDPRFLPRNQEFDVAVGDNQFAVIDGEVDVAECAVQLLAGELGPYPRAPDAGSALPEDEQAAAVRESRDNPFDVLRKLKEGP